MSFSLEINPGNKKVFFNLSRSAAGTKRGIKQGFWFIARELRTGVRKRIKEKPKTGRHYRIKGRRRRHRASAPGEDPANLTGKLRNSVGFQIRDTDMEFGYRDSVNYGKFLESGTSKMKPRPALTNQVNASAKNARGHFEREIKKALLNPRG